MPGPHDARPPSPQPEGDPPPVSRRPIVGVMGSGRDGHLRLSDPLGRMLAELGVHLLTGGGGGVMDAVSRAFHQTPGRMGRVIGVLPSSAEAPGRPPAGYPNRWVEIPIVTHLPWSGRRGIEEGSRNHINVLSSDALVVLPGAAGTASELALAVRYHRPTILFHDGRDPFPELAPGLERTDSLEVVGEFLRRVLGPLRPRSG